MNINHLNQILTYLHFNKRNSRKSELTVGKPKSIK